MRLAVSWKGAASRAAEKVAKSCASVEERRFQRRVSKFEINERFSACAVEMDAHRVFAASSIVPMSWPTSGFQPLWRRAPIGHSA